MPRPAKHSLYPASEHIDLKVLSSPLEKAHQALTSLNAAKNNRLLNYLYTRQETTDSLALEKHDTKVLTLIRYETNPAKFNETAVEDASNLLTATTFGIERLQRGFHINLKLLRSLHDIAFQRYANEGHSVGQFREEQNWIGGTGPHNALYIPPAPKDLNNHLRDFEFRLLSPPLELDPLVHTAILAASFDTIHPFSIGNRIMGRLMTSLWLKQNNHGASLLLPINRYYLQNSDLYFDRLQQVKRFQAWNDWFIFFLQGVSEACQEAAQKSFELETLFENDLKKINELGRSRFSCLEVFEYLKLCPEISAPELSTTLEISTPTARVALNMLVDLNIIVEATGKKRDKVYVWKKYLDYIV